MTHIWNFFISQNRFSFLLMGALLALGAYSIIMIPKESAPEIQIPIGIVSTVLSGASAEEIESLITNQLEPDLLSTLEEVNKVTSNSSRGVSTIVVEFDASADIDESIRDLTKQVDTLSNDLPEEATEPRVSEVNFVDQPILSIAIAGDVSEVELAEVAQKVESKLKKVVGVSRVEISGVGEEEINIVIDKLKLENTGLTLSDVIGALSSANTAFPVGSITTDGINYNIAFEGKIESVEDIESLLIPSAQGTSVYIRDIALVQQVRSEPATLDRLSVEGALSLPAVTLNVFKSRGGDITRIARDIGETVYSLKSSGEPLALYTTEIILDSGEQIERDLLQLSTSGLQTVFLVALLLIITIGWREGLLASLAIPLSFTIGFIGLYISGNTINFISLFALILAVGILVDSAIVMVEGMNKRFKENPTTDKKQVAKETVAEFSTPLITGTFTTIAMFSGLFLVSGVSGQFISGIPFTVNFVLLASLLVALGFIPLIASVFLKRSTHNKYEKKQKEYSSIMETRYSTWLTSLLQNRTRKIQFVSGLVVALIISLLLPVFGAVKVIFFEQEDIDWIFVEVEAPQGSTLTITDIEARKIEEVLYASPYIESFTTTVGASSAFSSNDGSAQSDDTASFFVTLIPERTKSSTEIVEILREELSFLNNPDISVGQPNNGPPTGTPFVARLLGEDLDELENTAFRVKQYLETIPGTVDVTTSADDNAVEFVIDLDAETASFYGLSSLTVSQYLRSSIFGVTATSINTLQDEIDVNVSLALNPEATSVRDTADVSIDEVKALAIPTQTGSSILLGSIADISLKRAPSSIAHEDGERVYTIGSNITPTGNLREVTAKFEENVRSVASIPSDITLEIGGENEESNRAFIEMFLSLIVGIVLMLAILVLQFNSFRHTFYVLSILPFSLIGILFGLALTGKALSFPSIMGFVALSGIVVNNSILLIDQMNNKRRSSPHTPLLQNVVASATARLRPILLTTITTVVGIFPLTFASDLWSPLAYAIMFGLAFSVCITLVLIPIIYLNKPGKLN